MLFCMPVSKYPYRHQLRSKSKFMCTKSNLAVIAMLLSLTSVAQVGIGTSSPHASAALEISSTNKGLLLPRMTTTERGSIPNPLPGMMIYNTTETKFQGYVGVPAVWINTDPNNSSSAAVTRGPGFESAQTFLAPSTEEIVRVTAQCEASGPGPTWPSGSATSIAKIYAGLYDSNNPGTPVATSGSVTISSLGTYNFDFNPTFQPTSNTTYTIVFTNTDNTNYLYFRENNSNTYADGYRYFPPTSTSNSNDLNLKFYSLTGSWIDL